MNKPDQNTRNKLHSLWFILLVVCIMITYYYQKSKATESYKRILQVAASNCNLEAIKFLVKDIVPGLSEKALHHAARGECLDTIKFLIIEEKVNVNAIDRDAFKRVALHHASGEGHLEVVKFLLARGGNPNIRGSNGRNPRDMAVIKSRHNKDKNKPYREIIKLLAAAEDTFDGKKECIIKKA